MNYSLHPEAEEDLRNAAEFYRGRAGNSLSNSLLAEFEHSVSILLRRPELGSPWRGGGRRRYLMRRFPYSLVYTLSGEEISILAVAHHNRHPNYWGARR
jgi:toxin ParE1/3/4